MAIYAQGAAGGEPLHKVVTPCDIKIKQDTSVGARTPSAHMYQGYMLHASRQLVGIWTP